MFKRSCVLSILACNLSLVSARENLALNKSYTFSPKANYYLCTDIGDTTELTDGKASGSRWTDKSTVGWQKAEPVVEIVMDLGDKCAIYDVVIHTIGGGFADVEFPEYVVVLLSDNNRRFEFVGLAGNKHLANFRSTSFGGISKTISIENINATGRYVKILIKPTRRYVFIDEVKVFGEPFSAVKNVNLRDNLEVFNSSEELLDRIEDYLQINTNITMAFETIKKNRLKLSRRLSNSILAELEKLARKTDTLTNRIYSANELLDIKEKAGKARARIYRAMYEKPFVCLAAEPMEVLFEKDVPLSGSTREINIKMWQNEYESAAFNIINCSGEAMTMMVSVSPLLNQVGQSINSNGTFTIRRSRYVKGCTVGLIADALILQAEHPFVVRPGELTQIWLTIFDPNLTAGIYRGLIGVLAETEKGETLPIESIPVTIEVQRHRFPENFALNTCNWAYYQVASAPEMAEDLRKHRMNVCVVPPQDLPFLRFSSDSPRTVRRPNFIKLDNALGHHNYAGTYLLCLDFNQNNKDYGRFGRVKWMTSRWKSVFSSWLEKLVRHLKEAGVDYDRFALYPFDESLCDDFYELAKLIKSTDPQVRIYANSFGKGPNEFERFRELVDIWCLQDSHCARHSKWLEQIKGFGKEIWTYECLEPMKAQDPYSYYRLLPWRAFERGQTGAGFWIYYYGLNFKPGAVPWDDTLRPLGFSGVVYGSQASPIPGLNENIVPSRRWEAWREGVEDYQYLYELQQTINRIKEQDAVTANIAQEILNRQVNRVLSNQDDRNIVYEAREILSDTLLKLTDTELRM